VSESKWSGSGGAGGGGDVFGPANSTDNAVARFDGTTGDTLQNSPVTIADNGDVAGVNDLDVAGNISANSLVTAQDITVFDGTSKEFNLGNEAYQANSTGAATWAGFTITGGGTTFTIGAGSGKIINHTSDTYTPVTWSALTGNNPATANGTTYVYINSAGAARLTTSFPTPDERRDYILLGRVVALSGTIVQTQSMINLAYDPVGFAADIAYGIGVFNIEGNEISANGANLNINKSAGKLFTPGGNFLTDPESPNWVTINSATAASFAYITQLVGSTGSTITAIDPTQYDSAGTVTAIGGTASRSTNQRIYLFPSGAIRVQYGQTVYSSLANAVDGIATEAFTVNPSIPGNGVLIGILSVRRDAIDLSNTAQARFFRASRFGEAAVGASGVASTTLQQAYNNSVSPEIITDTTRGALQIRRGSAADTDDVLTVENGSGTTQFSVKGNGNVEMQGNLIVQGDLTVNGTTTTINTATLDVEDKNIRVNVGGNDTSAEGAGLTVEGTGAATRGSIQYEAALGSKWKLGASGSEDEVVTRTLAQTFTNKTINGSNNTITNVSLSTGVTGTLPIANGGTGQTSKTAAFDALSPQTTKGDLIAFDGADAIRLGAGVNGQVLSANSSATSGLEWVDAPTAGGFINYITNPSAESSTTGWATYVNTAAATPTNGTGGVANVTWQRNTSSPIRGNADFAFAKDAANRQGQGVAFTFTISTTDRSKKCQITFDYDTSAANYAAGDMRVYVYDVTNATLITPQTVDIPKGTNTFVTTFDTTTSTSYRLILHVATINATAYTVDFDNFVVNAGQVVQGAAISEWQTFTPTLSTGALGTVAYNQARWRRVGSNMEVEWRMLQSTGTAGSGSYLITIPGSVTADTSFIQVNSIPTGHVGEANVRDNASFYLANVFLESSTRFGVDIQTSATARSTWGSGSAPLSGTNVGVDLRAIIPIAEWAGSGTVNLGAAGQPVYTFNDSVTTSSDTTAFAYGENGALIQSFAPAGTASVDKRVRCPYPDPKFAVLQVKRANRQWTNVAESILGFKTNDTAATYYGMDMIAVSGSSTDYDVRFYSAVLPSSAWSGENALGTRWRVVFANDPRAVGFGLASSSDSGLVRPRRGQQPLTVTGTNWATARAVGIYYQDQDGNHRLKFNIAGTLSSTTTAFTGTIDGVTFKNVANFTQAIACSLGEAGVASRATLDNYVNPGASTFTVAPTTGNFNRIRVSGDVELESRPTWA
jgi:hypothetical protein